MRTLSDLRKDFANRISRFSTDVVEVRGEECLVSDPRSRVKPTEHVERKLQVVMGRDRNSTFSS